VNTITVRRAPTMKTNLRRLSSAVLLAATFLSPAFAQQEPIIGVDINSITIEGNITITNGGSGYTTAPSVSVSGGGGSGATLTATVNNGRVTALTVETPGEGYTSIPTITIDAPTATPAVVASPTVTGGVVATGTLAITNPGSGYATAPTVTISGGPGTGATGTAKVVNGQVTQVSITAGGSGYTSPVTVTLSPPNGTQATAVVKRLWASFSEPFQNESYGPYNVPIDISAQAHGTFPSTGYTYTFYVNGAVLGQPFPTPTPLDKPGVVAWAPPQPGAYLLTVKASDGAHEATSLAVRYFATGTAIIGPVDNALVPNGSSVVIQATAVPPPIGANAFVQRVDFYIDDVLRGTDYTYPYSLIYTPETSSLAHKIEARAYDNNGHQISPDGTAVRHLTMVPPVGTPPTVRLLNPLDGTSVSSGAAVNLIADAVAPTGFIKNVDFYVNGVALNSSQTFPFTTTWSSKTPGKYQFVAIAFDDKSNSVASDPITVTVTGGFPTIEITQPSTATTVIQGVPLSVGVKAAGADGGITSLQKIDLLVDGTVSDSLPKNPLNQVPPPPLTQPFVFSWTSNVALGNHKLSARVTDNNGLVITSAEIPITVIANQLPSVRLTNPQDGDSGTAGTTMTITADAADPDGQVTSVEFFANGASLGDPVTQAPFQWAWTPKAAGAYTLAAKVTDNAGGTKTSSTVSVTVSPASTGGGGATNSVYRGDYGSPSETGHFTLGVNRTGRGTFVAFSTTPAGKTYYWSDFPVDPDGTFAVEDPATHLVLKGQTSSTGVVGTFGQKSEDFAFGDKTFIGPISVGSSTPLILSGSLGTGGTTLVAMLGGDGTLTLYSASGSKTDAGTGVVSPTGAYAITTPSGGAYSGNVTANLSVISGTATGGTSGSFLLSQAPSRLINLSTLATAGSGDRTLVAGFTLVGNGARPVVIRAIGPTLTNFGVGNVLANPTLALVTSANAPITSNDDWNSSLGPTMDGLGAFPLNTGSKDAALQTSLAPGVYSAVIGGAQSTGAAMVEIYDAQPSGSATSRLLNLSARTLLVPGDTLIAGFVISGDQRKKLLIRAVGPSLTNYGISNPLEDPKLDVLVGGTAVASNDNWSASQIGTSASSAQAFPLVAGSKDAATVVQLSPGSYSVHVTGTSPAAGVVLVEIYDLDP
jgi:hypothetical protein